jgi:carbonic anhydrase
VKGTRESGCDHARRDLFKLSGALAAWGALGVVGLRSVPAMAAALTKAQRDRMTPEDVLALMKNGNERFREGKQGSGSLAQQRTAAQGQHPAAVLLTCIDSREPAEAILDLGIGEVFNCRVAGNIDNEVLGSMEFACKLAGAKVVLVMGHTGCGAIKGAIDQAEMSNLSDRLAKIRPAVEATVYAGERTSKNEAFVNAVARRNVELTLESIRKRSPVLAELESAHGLLLAGAMHDLETGVVEFFPGS